MSTNKSPDIQIVSKQGNVITFPTAMKKVQFGDVIKQARQRKRLTQKEFSNKIGVTRHAIMNWEANNSKPDHAYIPRVCSVLGISLEDLYQVKPAYTSFERKLIHQVRYLKPTSQRIVLKMVNAILDEELAAHDEMLVNSYRILDNRDGALAAGTASSGVSIIEDQPTPIFVQINDMTKHADAVITVRGRSMEPKYHPGDKVCFEYTNVSNVGDDIAVWWAGDTFIKRMADDGTLYSLNKEYPFIYDGDGTDIQILGRVLGVLDRKDLPDESDLISLQDLFEDQLKEYDNH